MALHIRNRKTEEQVRHLAAMKKIGVTAAIDLAVANEIKRAPLLERIRPIQEEVGALGNSGHRAAEAAGISDRG